jgi:hypothetical protein
MFRNALFLGITTSVLSSIGAITYAANYNSQIHDYSGFLSYVSIASACVFVSIFACIMFWAATMLMKNTGEIIFNIVFAFGTMSSIYFPLNSTIENDSFGYFMVYAIPLHFFPVLSWFVLRPVFIKGSK